MKFLKPRVIGTLAITPAYHLLAISYLVLRGRMRKAGLEIFLSKKKKKKKRELLPSSTNQE
jgi:hypothetical protein